MMKVLGNHILWRQILFVIISGELLSGYKTHTASFCSNKLQKFNVTTLRCQQNYTFVSVSLEWRRNACEQPNLYINDAPHAAYKCYNSSLKLIVDDIRNKSGCVSWCTNEFAYEYANQFPRVEDAKKQCSNNRNSGNVDQIWLHYKCDGDVEAASSASPDHKTYTQSLARSSKSSVSVTTQPASSGMGAGSSTRNPLPRTDSPERTSTDTITTQGDAHPYIVYAILSVVIVSLCVTVVVIIIVCRKKI